MSEANTTTTTRRTYGKKHRMGTMGILRRGDEVLLIHRRLKTPEFQENGPPDTWSFPGGGVDEDETPEKAIVREFKEEVGLNVTIVPIGDEPVWGETDDYLDEPWRCFIYRVEQVDPTQEPEVIEPHKHIAVEWLSWSELWANIKATAPSHDEHHEPSASGNMRFFPTLKNMVEKYPKRANPASLERRV